MRLDLVVGPNGAGKSTFVERILLPALPPGTPFVNADVIAARRWPHAPEAHSYEAAELAAATRRALIAEERAFVAETVFSHPSKLDLVAQARDAGFTVVLHVLLVPEDLSVLRVERRAAAGGHDVPEDKIRARHRRLWALVAEAAVSCDRAVFYDGSRHQGPRVAARLVEGIAVEEARWPSWAPGVLTTTWPPRAEV